jgi:periplasmic protein CpxP/Spy
VFPLPSLCRRVPANPADVQLNLILETTMMTRTTTLSRLAILLLAAAPMSALAQPAPPPISPAPTSPARTSPAPAPSTAASPQSQVQAATEQRITGLRTQLAITPAQMTEWNAFAQVMRDNAASTDALFRQRAAGAHTMNAVANMKSYAQVAHAYSDETEKLSAAFETLYGTFSDAQKQAADKLFQQQAAAGAAPQAAAK